MAISHKRVESPPLTTIHMLARQSIANHCSNLNWAQLWCRTSFGHKRTDGRTRPKRKSTNRYSNAWVHAQLCGRVAVRRACNLGETTSSSSSSRHTCTRRLPLSMRIGLGVVQSRCRPSLFGRWLSTCVHRRLPSLTACWWSSTQEYHFVCVYCACMRQPWMTVVVAGGGGVVIAWLLPAELRLRPSTQSRLACSHFRFVHLMNL